MKIATRSTTSRARRATSKATTASATGKRKFAAVKSSELTKEEKRAARLRSKERARQWCIETYGEEMLQEDDEEEEPPTKSRRQENMTSPSSRISKRQILEAKHRQNQLKYDTTLTEAQKRRLRAQIQADAAAIAAVAAAATPKVAPKTKAAATPKVAPKMKAAAIPRKRVTSVAVASPTRTLAPSAVPVAVAKQPAATTMRPTRQQTKKLGVSPTPVAPLEPQEREPAVRVSRSVMQQHEMVWKQETPAENRFTALVSSCWSSRFAGISRRAEHLEVVDDDAQDKQENSFSSKPWWYWLLPLMLGILVGSVGVMLENIFVSTPTTARKEYSACFKNSATDDNFLWTTSEACQKVPQGAWLPCPEDARCVGGILEECGLHRQVVDGKACAMTETANKTVQDMVTALKKWSMDDICYPRVKSHVIGRSDAGNIRLFGLEQVAGELESSIDLLLVELANDSRPVFVWDGISKARGGIRIGLHPAQGMPLLPPRCIVKLALKTTEQGLVDCIFTLLLRPMWFVLSVILVLFWEDPLGSAFFFLLLPAIIVARVSARRRQQLNKELQHDCTLLKDLVCKVLRANREKAHSILCLRDHFLCDATLAFSESVEATERMKTEVWPLVVSAFAVDNRVAKARSAVDGDTWQWKKMAP